MLGVAELTAAEAVAAGAKGAEAVEGVLYDALVTRTPADEAVGAVEAALNIVDPTDGAALQALSPTPAGRGVWWTLGGERHPPLVVQSAEPPRDLLLQILQPSSQLEMAT